jgi:hypothetical protein
MLNVGWLSTALASALVSSAVQAETSTDEWDFVRVDVADYPGALTSSEIGSMLDTPPTDGTAWRTESIAVPDAYDAYEAKEALGTETWLAQHADGTGVDVAVFDLQWSDAALREAELGEYSTHDCYTHRSCDAEMDTLRERFSFEQGSHGVACAEVIRDLAPGVNLHLVRVNGLTTFEKAAAWAIRNEIDLVSMSLSFFGESFFDGTGAVSSVVDEMANAGVLLVTSAGNYAQSHWLGAFEDADGDSFHRFDDDEYLPVYFSSSGSHRVSLTWDEFGHCGTSDFDLYVYAGDGTVAGKSEDVQSASTGRCEPVEGANAWVESPGWYYVAIRRDRGTSSDTRLSIIARSGFVYGGTPEGSITDPGAHPLAFTVGAVDATGYLRNDAESFSSRGPTRNGADKPDLVGPDGVSTRTYGERGFYGTSASAPAVTAALALMMSEQPELSAYDAAKKLKDLSISQNPSWAAPDPAIGAGYARLQPAAVETSGCGGGALILPILLWFPLFRIRRMFSTDAGTP